MPWTGTKRCGGVLVGVPMDIDKDGWETEGDVEQRMERALADCRSKGIPVSLLPYPHEIYADISSAG